MSFKYYLAIEDWFVGFMRAALNSWILPWLSPSITDSTDGEQSEGEKLFIFYRNLFYSILRCFLQKENWSFEKSSPDSERLWTPVTWNPSPHRLQSIDPHSESREHKSLQAPRNLKCFILWKRTCWLTCIRMMWKTLWSLFFHSKDHLLCRWKPLPLIETSGVMFPPYSYWSNRHLKNARFWARNYPCWPKTYWSRNAINFWVLDKMSLFE